MLQSVSDLVCHRSLQHQCLVKVQKIYNFSEKKVMKRIEQIFILLLLARIVNSCGKADESVLDNENALFPWNVLVYIDDFFSCGGVVISDKHILTSKNLSFLQFLLF
jgi:hypothetical protein